MENFTPAASQENVLFSRPASPDGENLQSSPMLPLPGRTTGSRPRKAPTITPKSFTRFFTPKTSLDRGEKIGASRQALIDISASAINRKRKRRPVEVALPTPREDVENHTFLSRGRKRRLSESSTTTPDRSSPIRDMRNQSLDIVDYDSTDQISEVIERKEHLREALIQPRRVLSSTKVYLPSDYRGPLGRELQRETGILAEGAQRYLRASGLGGLSNWQHETTNFFTKSEGSHACMNLAKPTRDTLPFCVASCNQHSLVAISDEDGGIRLLESAKGEKPGFSTVYLAFQPHDNAVIDLAFSADDLLLATASGDQESRVIDMLSQRTICKMAEHVASVKQVVFQPGNSSVVATSSRDGSVQIFDLRYKGYNAPALKMQAFLDPQTSNSASRSQPGDKMSWARPISSIFEAHSDRYTAVSNSASGKIYAPNFDGSSKTESSGRKGDVSVTALSFLQPGREHLLLTGSEANAVIKLWDLRTTQTHRRGYARPLSSTEQPESHDAHRGFGLTSLSLSSDGGRLYALCKDHTVYAYSTSHMILGHAPELSKTSSKQRRPVGFERKGLGPIYGLRHPRFQASSFFVKSALRPAVDGRSELIAVGSGDHCAVVFATNEQYLQHWNHRQASPYQLPSSKARRAPISIGGSTGVWRQSDTIPIYTLGSALVEGHDAEVTVPSWTHNGELITLSDDRTARCWREGPEARDLRIGGAGEGRRWMSGWAEAEEDWDEDDG